MHLAKLRTLNWTPTNDFARWCENDPSRIVKLASNENPLGMSQKARLNAMTAALHPNSIGFDLKGAIGRKFDVPRSWITLGAGSAEIIELIASAFLAVGRSAVCAQYAFFAYAHATLRAGAHGIVVDARDFSHDLDAMCRAIRIDTSVIFVANPNNPTGTYLPPDRLERFIARVRSDVVIVLDEAYNEYLAPEMQYDSSAWVRRYPNLVVTRTFSKAYGLAGFRIGYSISSPELANCLHSNRTNLSVSNVAQAAAIGALEDQAFQEETYRINMNGLEQFARGFRKLAIPCLESCGNFVLARFGSYTARINAYLLRHGIMVAAVHDYGLGDWLRISVGMPDESELFLFTLKRAVTEA
ncbi:pyridoxal phosphate-dependent aminotransferase [Burkholderia sp. Bp9143]|uniref:pyridoxal phosphate-dependent aminotransferase n=1 Tax=Burkholderia sp. Bp9143 TaxID=2184574 RepID=UPI003908B4EB